MGERIDLLARIKELENQVDYYKHEYYAECDRSEKLEKALDKACETIVENEEIIIWEYSANIDIDSKENTVKKWKEWCFKDE